MYLIRPPLIQVLQSIKFSYVLEDVNNDQRPYLRISILHVNLLGLLDSGATRIIVGYKGWEMLRYLNLPSDTPKATTCTIANGSICESNRRCSSTRAALT